MDLRHIVNVVLVQLQELGRSKLHVMMVLSDLAGNIPRTAPLDKHPLTADTPEPTKFYLRQTTWFIGPHVPLDLQNFITVR